MHYAVVKLSLVHYSDSFLRKPPSCKVYNSEPLRFASLIQRYFGFCYFTKVLKGLFELEPCHTVRQIPNED